MGAQCDKMEMLANYDALKSKAVKLSKDGNEEYFYIGYSEQKLRSMYLWTTYPDNEKFREFAGTLVKSQTYYTRLNGKKGETEDSLIKLFVEGNKICHDRCLNWNHWGEHGTKGFVYVLVYTKNS